MNDYPRTEVPPEYGYCKMCGDASVFVVTWDEEGDDWAEERYGRMCPQHATLIVLDPHVSHVNVRQLGSGS